LPSNSEKAGQKVEKPC